MRNCGTSKNVVYNGKLRVQGFITPKIAITLNKTWLNFFNKHKLSLLVEDVLRNVMFLKKKEIIIHNGDRHKINYLGQRYGHEKPVCRPSFLYTSQDSLK